MSKSLVLILFLAVLIMRPSSLMAVDPADAPPGASAEVIEAKVTDEAEAKLLRPKQSAEQVEEDETAPTDGKQKKISFYLEKIYLQGDDRLPPETFRELLSQYEGREVNFDEIQKLSKSIERVYREKGLFAVVYVPPQRVENKELTLAILVSRMGKLQVEGNRYFRESKIKSYWEIPAGEILSYHKIRSSLLSMNENPDRTIRPLLRAGEVKGTTDVLLRVEDHFPLHVGYSLDNGGVKLTGKDRHGFTIRSNNLSGLDDIFLIGTSFGDSFGALFLQHVIPLSSFGTKFVWGFSHAQVNPKKEFERFGINGISQTYTLGLRQRLYRSERVVAEAHVNFDFKEKTTRILSVTTVWDRLRILTLGGNAQLKDTWGAWMASHDLGIGIPLHGDGYPLNSRGGETQFFKFEFSLARQQRMPFKTRLVARLNGQLTDSRLTPQEQIFFGGASTIRGYPESDFLGDQGMITNVDYVVPFGFLPPELKLPYDTQPISQQLNWISFVDHGYGRLNEPTATERNTRNLLGVGSGFQIRYRENLALRVEWGVPLGDRPITESGKSQVHFRLSADI